jgi:hypothetical protein
MQFVVILKGRRDLAFGELGPHLRPEAAKAWEMWVSDVLRCKD